MLVTTSLKFVRYKEDRWNEQSFKRLIERAGQKFECTFAVAIAKSVVLRAFRRVEFRGE
jgi:hypothetical protein